LGIPNLEDIKSAAELIKPYIKKTSVLNSSAINSICGSEISFKCENFQKTGAFKIRGAVNAVLNLNKKEIKRGVATHSSGNHAAALALSAKYLNVKAFVVMPENAPEIKKKAVKGYGAEIILSESTLKSREETLKKLISKTGASFIHPYNDYNVISGQGTVALEFLEEKEDFDIIMVPIGGGGLASGTAISVKNINPKIKLIGAEPLLADDAYNSFHTGKLFPSLNSNTIADGLKTSLGDKTFPIIRAYFDEIIRVDEVRIIEAMRMIWERMKIIIEPSSAVPLGAILGNKEMFKDKSIGIILSGGNVGLDMLPF